MSFIHLRALSHYSIGKSNLLIESIVKACIKHKMPAICLSDHENLFGSLEFSLHAIEKGVQPILGCTLGIDCSSINSHRSFNVHQASPILPKFLLIAKNESGYKNLVHLLTYSYITRNTQINRAPVVPIKELLSYSSDLMIFVGSKESMTNQIYNAHAETKRWKDQKDTVLSSLFKTLANSMEVFCELQRYDFDINESERENILLELAYDLQIPIVASNPISFSATRKP